MRAGASELLNRLRPFSLGGGAPQPAPKATFAVACVPRLAIRCARVGELARPPAACAVPKSAP